MIGKDCREKLGPRRKSFLGEGLAIDGKSVGGNAVIVGKCRKIDGVNLTTVGND